MVLAVAIKNTNLLSLLALLAFFASFVHAQDRGRCTVNEDGFFFGDQEDIPDPVYRIINFHYELEYEQDADFDTLLNQLEKAMSTSMLNNSLLYRNMCSPSERGLNLNPNFSMAPLDQVDIIQCPNRVSPAGTKCHVMRGQVTIYYPANKHSSYESQHRHIGMSLQYAVDNAAKNGVYLTIDGITHVQYYLKGQYNLLKEKSTENTSNSSGTSSTNTTAGKLSYLAPVIAGSVALGILLFGTVLLQFRRKIRPENKFQATVRTSSTIV